MSRKWHSFSQNGTQAASRTVSWMCAMPLISMPMATMLRAPRLAIQVSPRGPAPEPIAADLSRRRGVPGGLRTSKPPWSGSGGLADSWIRSSSARSAHHRNDGRRAAHTDLANHLEAVAPVQGDVRGIRRLEIRVQVLLVDTRERVTEQRGADALPLMRGIDADEGEVP